MRRKVIFSALFGVCVFSTLAWGQVVTEKWAARYNGPGNVNDVATTLAVDNNGNIYVSGYSFGSGTDYDFATIKYDANGDTLWVRRFNGPDNIDDYVYGVAVDASGNAYVTGAVWDSVDSDYATIKYAPNGDTLWVRYYNGPGSSDDSPLALAVDASGNTYVTGTSSGGVTATDYATIKYAPNGDTLWVRRYNGLGNSSDHAYGVKVDASGNTYVTGHSSGGASGFDYATLKYAPNGDTLWVSRYDGPASSTDQAYALALDASGNIYVAGRSVGSGTSHDYATIKYAPNGDTLWVRRYNGPGNLEDYAWGMAVDDSGNAYVTGQSNGGASGYDYATIKYAPNGDTLWVRRYNGPGNGLDRALAVALDASGNVYVTGYSFDSANNFDYATIKYSPTGDSLWVKRYNGPANLGDFAFDLALDASENVYVTGQSADSGGLYDYATVKYDQIYPIIIQAYSPVDLIVTDPNLDSIGVSFNTILNSNYSLVNDSIFIQQGLPGNYRIRVVKDPFDVSGDTTYTISVRIDGKDQQNIASNWPVPDSGQEASFTITYETPVPECVIHPGDANADATLNLSDVIRTINYVFNKSGYPSCGSHSKLCWLADMVCRGDWNGDNKVQLTDVIRGVNKVFNKPGNWNPTPVADCCLPVQ